MIGACACAMHGIKPTEFRSPEKRRKNTKILFEIVRFDVRFDDASTWIMTGIRNSMEQMKNRKNDGTFFQQTIDISSSSSSSFAQHLDDAPNKIKPNRTQGKEAEGRPRRSRRQTVGRRWMIEVNLIWIIVLSTWAMIHWMNMSATQILIRINNTNKWTRTARRERETEKKHNKFRL